MKVALSVGFLAALGDAKTERSPSMRAEKNQQFLEDWFDRNCKRDAETIEAPRPGRCENKFTRWMTEWAKLLESFERCGYYWDKEAGKAFGGKALEGRRQRREEDDDEWLEGDDEDEDDAGSLFDNDIFNLTQEELEEIQIKDEQGTDQKNSGKTDYWYFFEEFAGDYLDVDNEVVHSTADEDNGILSRSSSPQEARAMSKDPARALRQLGNSMKQYVKRFLDDCTTQRQKLDRLTQVYRKTAEVHEKVVEVIADRYRRLDERNHRNKL